MALWILINYVPFIFALGIGATVYFFNWWMAVLVFYLLPPLLSRVTVLAAGHPSVKENVPSAGSYVWWFTSQLQAPFMRFSFLEEILRMVPGLYSVWLRLWGAKVGKFVFWSPTTLVVDRPFVEIGDRVVFGYGAKLTAHLLTKGKRGQTFSLIFAAPKVGHDAILGTLSAVGPGAEVGAGETLMATAALPPFHRLKNNQTFTPEGTISKTTFITTHEEA